MLEPASATAALGPLSEDDPLPPDDLLSSEQLRIELEILYRKNAGTFADQLQRSGTKDSLDLVHEAFARILGFGRPKLLSISKPHAYVATISRNLRKDRGRSQALHSAWAEEVVATGAQHHDPVVYLESRDSLRRLEAAVMKLKPRTREIFLARRVEGQSYAEISTATGLSPKAIEKHMAKAIAKLSRFMDRK